MRRVLLATALAAASIAVPTATGSVAEAQTTTSSNPWNVTVVRFDPARRVPVSRRVKNSGGVVATDLSRINALAVVSTNKTFRTDVKASCRVRAVWLDKVVRSAPPEAGGGAGLTGNNTPQIGHPGTDPVPDPFHDATSFLGETNPEGILQWDDNRMNVPAAWAKTLGDRTVRVAVIDSGLDGSHKELARQLRQPDLRQHDPLQLAGAAAPAHSWPDGLNSADAEGHGTWVASRIAGAVNGFASNGIAPNVQIVGYKVLSTTLGGGLTRLDRRRDVTTPATTTSFLINMSLGGYDAPAVPPPTSRTTCCGWTR